MRGIVVVDQPVEDRVVVWQVNVGDGLESTMAGAWVLPAHDERIDGLITGRVRVTTPAAVRRFGAGPEIASLALAVQAQIDDIDGAFTAHLARLPSSKRSLVRPRWPRIDQQPVWVSAGDPLTSQALTLARWTSDLLVAWSKVERARLARPFLAVRGGEVIREFPPGWLPDNTSEEAS